MSVIVYASRQTEASRKLVTAVARASTEASIEVLRAPEALSSRLREPMRDLEVAVLLIANREELAKFRAIRPMLSDVRVILVLSGSGDKMISMGHALYPRFLTHVSNGFSDVEAVVGKMLAGTSKGRDASLRLEDAQDRSHGLDVGQGFGPA